MAKQDINLGTQPTGVGGDTNRSANVKINANFTELYKAMGATVNGGNGSVLPATGLPIANGGTGATTAADARTNLGLGTSALKDTGTSGDAVPLLNAKNTWSEKQTYNYLEGNVRQTEKLGSLAVAGASASLINIEFNINSSTMTFVEIDVRSISMFGQGKLYIQFYTISAKIADLSAYFVGNISGKHASGSLKDFLSSIRIELGGTPQKARIILGNLTNQILYTYFTVAKIIQGYSVSSNVISDFKIESLTAYPTSFTLSETVPVLFSVNENDLGFTAANRLVSVAAGGTGATTAAAARTNLGLGAAAVKDVGTLPGNVMEVGAFNVGAGSVFAQPGDSTPIFAEFRTYAPSITGLGSQLSGITIPWASAGSGRNMHAIACTGASSNPAWYTLRWGAGAVASTYKIRTEANTTVDSNGFLKNASPIVELYADKIELNDEAKLQNITFEKLGIGDYLIKNSSGFAQEGWYVEQPKDANGNIFHAVVYDTLTNGDISVKTYEQKLDGVKIVADLDKPVDIKETRFISIRLQELPQEPIEEPQPEPQPDPTITDYQGNPAPSHLHELQNGLWVISKENEAALEQERLEKMPALTRRQFRMALVLNGYNLADIETLINSIEDPMQRQITMIEWQDATTFHRTNPSLIVMAGLMGLDAETVDQLWLQASTL